MCIIIGSKIKTCDVGLVLAYGKILSKQDIFVEVQANIDQNLVVDNV